MTDRSSAETARHDAFKKAIWSVADAHPSNQASLPNIRRLQECPTALFRDIMVSMQNLGSPQCAAKVFAVRPPSPADMAHWLARPSAKNGSPSWLWVALSLCPQEHPDVPGILYDWLSSSKRPTSRHEEEQRHQNGFPPSPISTSACHRTLQSFIGKPMSAETAPAWATVISLLIKDGHAEDLLHMPWGETWSHEEVRPILARAVLRTWLDIDDDGTPHNPERLQKILQPHHAHLLADVVDVVLSSTHNPPGIEALNISALEVALPKMCDTFEHLSDATLQAVLGCSSKTALRIPDNFMYLAAHRTSQAITQALPTTISPAPKTLKM